jgi:hypothetical protein
VLSVSIVEKKIFPISDVFQDAVTNLGAGIARARSNVVSLWRSVIGDYPGALLRHECFYKSL